MVVVFPTPLTPTTIITYGFLFSGSSKSEAFPESTSLNRPAISSRRILFNSSVPKYLSFATRASILSIILRVVLTPTSLETKTSSRLSRTSSSTLLFPATALLNFSKKEVFVFSNPLSRVSFFSLENIFLNKLIVKCSVLGDQFYNFVFVNDKNLAVDFELVKIRKATFVKKWLQSNIF